MFVVLTVIVGGQRDKRIRGFCEVDYLVLDVGRQRVGGGYVYIFLGGLRSGKRGICSIHTSQSKINSENTSRRGICFS